MASKAVSDRRLICACSSDALFICYAIDRETGGHLNEKVGRAVSQADTSASGR